MVSDLPAPDINSCPSYVSENVVKVIFSRTNERRAVITQDRNGRYRVRTEYWCLSDFEYIGKGYWVQDDRFSTITDTIETAQKLANEVLHEP